MVMNTLHYSRTMSLEDIISTTPKLQEFISTVGLVPKSSPQDINQVVLTRSELETTINEAVNKIIGEMQKKEIINKEYITREEAARLLNVTIPTLHRYAKAGKIRIYKFGSRSLLKT